MTLQVMLLPCSGLEYSGLHTNRFRRRLITSHKVESVKPVEVVGMSNVSALDGAMVIVKVAVLAVDPFRKYATRVEVVVQLFPYWARCTLKTRKIMECDQA